MDLNDFSPVKENEKMDIVTAQFALMFTEDFAGSLGEVHSVLREGGLLVGTVWEEFPYSSASEGDDDKSAGGRTASAAN